MKVRKPIGYLSDWRPKYPRRRRCACGEWNCFACNWSSGWSRALLQNLSRTDLDELVRRELVREAGLVRGETAVTIGSALVDRSLEGIETLARDPYRARAGGVPER